MSLLSDRDLKSLLSAGKLVVEPLDKNINPTSIDLRLGSTLIQYTDPIIRLDTKPKYKEIDITSEGYLLAPGEFVLGMTKEIVSIPNGYQGFIETKGNIARAGIQVHNGDGHIDPGFSGNITLEICNMHRNGSSILLAPDIYVCQLFVYKLSSECDAPYKGRYSGHRKPTIYIP